MSGQARLRRIAAWLASPPARLAGLLLLFLWPWAAVGRAWAVVVTGVARLSLNTGSVALRYQAGDDPWRLRIVAEELATGRFVETALDLRRAGYIAVAVFVALVLATPVSWRRRAALLGLGLVPLLLLPLLPIVARFSGSLAVNAFDLGVVARAVAGIAYHVLVAAPGMAFAVPALLWLLLMGGVRARPAARVATARDRPPAACRSTTRPTRRQASAPRWRARRPPLTAVSGWEPRKPAQVAESREAMSRRWGGPRLA